MRKKKHSSSNFQLISVNFILFIHIGPAKLVKLPESIKTTIDCHCCLSVESHKIAFTCNAWKTAHYRSKTRSIIKFKLKLHFPFETMANRMAQLSDDLEYISVSYLGDLKKKYSLHSYRLHPRACLLKFKGWKQQQ